MHVRDSLLPTIELGTHDRHACAAGRRTQQRRGDNTHGTHATRLGYVHNTNVPRQRTSVATKILCHDRLV